MKNESEKGLNLQADQDTGLSENDYIPNTVLGQFRFLVLIFILILVSILIFVCLRFLGFYENTENGNGQFENPIFSTGGNPSETPEIPGVKVFNAIEDVEEINEDTSSRNSEFYSNIDQMEKNRQRPDDVKMMKQRDCFAAEKLEFLKKIEKAPSKTERQVFIDQLRNMMTDNHNNQK